MLKSSLGAAFALSGLVSVANADLIDPSGNLVSGNNNETVMKGLLGFDVDLLYKAEYDDGDFAGEDGLFTGEGPSGSFFTITDPTGSDFNEADISWDLAGSGYELRAVAWKSANQFWWSGIEPDQYVDGGPHTIATSGQAISGISFYGVQDTTAVPEGGATIMLLGSVLIGFGVARFYRGET